MSVQHGPGGPQSFHASRRIGQPLVRLRPVVPSQERTSLRPNLRCLRVPPPRGSGHAGARSQLRPRWPCRRAIVPCQRPASGPLPKGCQPAGGVSRGRRREWRRRIFAPPPGLGLLSAQGLKDSALTSAGTGRRRSRPRGPRPPASRNGAPPPPSRPASSRCEAPAARRC